MTTFAITSFECFLDDSYVKRPIMLPKEDAPNTSHCEPNIAVLGCRWLEWNLYPKGSGILANGVQAFDTTSGK